LFSPKNNKRKENFILEKNLINARKGDKLETYYHPLSKIIELLRIFYHKIGVIKNNKSEYLATLI